MRLTWENRITKKCFFNNRMMKYWLTTAIILTKYTTVAQKRYHSLLENETLLFKSLVTLTKTVHNNVQIAIKLGVRMPTSDLISKPESGNRRQHEVRLNAKHCE